MDLFFYGFAWLRAAIKRAIPVVWWQQLLAVLGLVCLIIVSSLLWIEVSGKFPFLPVGSYLGNVYGIFDDEDPDIDGDKFPITLWRLFRLARWYDTCLKTDDDRKRFHSMWHDLSKYLNRWGWWYKWRYR